MSTGSTAPPEEETFSTAEEWARAADAQDALSRYREEFALPALADGRPSIYFCGNSLGLMARRTREIVDAELDAWAGLGVDGHFKSDGPWFAYHDLVRDPVGSVRKLYAFFGDELLPEAEASMERYVAENRGDKYGRHVYTLEEWNLSADAIRERFAAYINRFDVPEE